MKRLNPMPVPMPGYVTGRLRVLWSLAFTVMNLRSIPRLWSVTAVIATCFFGIGNANAYDWMRYDADNLTIYSDCSPSKVKTLGRHFAAYQHTLRERILPPGTPLRHTTLVLFADTREFEMYFQPEETSFGKWITLHYTKPVARDRLIATVGDNRLDERINSIVELDISFLLRWYAEAPPKWLELALTDSFSRFRYRRGTAALDDPKDNLRVALKTDEWRDWTVVIGGAKDETAYEGKEPTNIVPAQRGLLGDWMLSGIELARPACFNILNAYRTDFPAGLDTFLRGVGMSSARLTDELHGYFRHRGLNRLPQFDGDAFEAGLKVAPAQVEDIHLIKFHLLFGREPRSLALDELQRAIAIGRDTEDVRIAKVFAAKLQNDRETLIKICDAAINDGTRNPFFYLNRATARLFHESYSPSEQFGLSRQSKAEMNATELEVTAAMKEIRIAMQLDPVNPHNYVLMAEALNLLPKVTPEQIDELSPGVCETKAGRFVRLIRGLLRQRIGEIGKADGDIEHILKIHPDSPEAKYIRAERDRVAANKASADANTLLNNLITQRRFADARKLLEERLVDETNSTRRNVYEKEINRLGEMIAWDEVTGLVREERWPEVKSAAEKYLEQYPKSHRVQVIKNRLRKAKEILGL